MGEQYPLFLLQKIKKNFLKGVDFWISISYNIVTVKEELNK